MPHIRTLIALVVLTGLGYAGNVLSLPLAFSVSLLLGSIFVIIAVSLFGPLLGGLSALIASSYTYILWNHPYAIIIFVCEALWVGFFLKRKHTNIVLIDAVYWLIIGLPLVFIFYFGVMSLGFQSASIIFMKQAINGIVNALVASILITYLPLRKWFGRASVQPVIPLSQVIFQLTSAFLMLPLLGMLLFTNYQEAKTIQKMAGELIVAESHEADELIEAWLERQTVAVKTIAKLGKDNNFQPSANTQASLEQITLLFPDLHNVFIANKKATTVAFFPAVNEKGETTIGMNFADREYFRQLKSTLKPVISDVFQGRGGVFSPIFTISVPVVEAGKLTGFALGAVNLDKMRNLLERCSHNNNIVFTIVDQHNKIVCSTNPSNTALTPLKQKTEGQTLLIGKNFSLWTPDTKKNISFMDAWKDATYFITIPIDGTTWKLMTEVPIAPFQAYIYQETIVNLILIFCLFIASIIVSQIISKLLSRTPVKLAAISRDIPQKLEKNIDMNWPDSNIEEMQHLIENFKQSTKELSLQYQNIKNTNIHLEEKVQQRTTELQKNEDVLKQTRQNYEAFFNTIDEFLFVLDEQGNIIHTNSTVINRLGYTTEELFGLSVLMVHPPDRREEAGRIVGEMLKGTTEFCPVPLVTKTGVQIPVETRISQGSWNGKPVIFGVTKDISQVRLSEEKFSKVFYINPSICGLSDLDTGKYIEVNEAFRTLLGFDKNEVIGKSATELGILTPEAKNTVLLKSDINGNVTNAETDLKAKNGDILHVLLSSENIFVQDKKYRFTIAHDITAQKNAEAEKEKLEAQNRQLQKTESLSRMAAAIAHHFNNQLGVVIGNLEMAIDEQPKGAPPARHLASAMDAAWKSANMSRLMLTYLGQSSDKREPLDLSHFCRKILPILNAAMPEKVILETNFPLSGLVINTSTDYVQQILTNLINNAWEAIGKNTGSISLSIKPVTPAQIPAKNRFPIDWQLQDNAYACLEVKDTGCGIEGEDIEKIFDPFYSTKFTGRGMGLAVVLGIVNAHKGVITVESKPKHGSTLRIFFPVSEEAPRQTQMAESKDDSLISDVSPTRLEEGGTVLVVEDEAMLRDMAAAMLESFGFTVLKAKDGIEALEVFGKHQNEIKFVLTDLTMPRMNGWETLTELRKLKPNIPVILASGYDLAHVMEGEHPELPQAFLAKPYNLKALRNAITQALESRKG